MLVGADAGQLDRHILRIGIKRQSLENARKNATFAPSPQALVRRLPVAVALWQITPWNAGSVSIYDGIDKQAVVRRRAANVALPTGQKVLDLIHWSSRKA